MEDRFESNTQPNKKKNAYRRRRRRHRERGEKWTIGLRVGDVLSRARAHQRACRTTDNNHSRRLGNSAREGGGGGGSVGGCGGSEKCETARATYNDGRAGARDRSRRGGERERT